MLAAVFGPGPPRYSRKERIEGAAIEVGGCGEGGEMGGNGSRRE